MHCSLGKQEQDIDFAGALTVSQPLPVPLLQQMQQVPGAYKCTSSVLNDAKASKGGLSTCVTYATGASKIAT